MRIQNNITAMNTHRQYTINNDNVAKNAEKLSSGYRINRAGDDAAGLAISEKMRSQIRGLNMATKNSQDAISLVQTAEGALQETQNMLQRMNELAVQAATGTNETLDRSALAKEFEQLKREINDIAEQTTFNNMKILDGSMSYQGYQRSAATAGITTTRPTIVGGTAGSSATAPGTSTTPEVLGAVISSDLTSDADKVVKGGDLTLSVNYTDTDGREKTLTFKATADATGATVEELVNKMTPADAESKDWGLEMKDGKVTLTFRDGEPPIDMTKDLTVGLTTGSGVTVEESKTSSTAATLDASTKAAAATIETATADTGLSGTNSTIKISGTTLTGAAIHSGTAYTSVSTKVQIGEDILTVTVTGATASGGTAPSASTTLAAAASGSDVALSAKVTDADGNEVEGWTAEVNSDGTITLTSTAAPKDDAEAEAINNATVLSGANGGLGEIADGDAVAGTATVDAASTGGTPATNATITASVDKANVADATVAANDEVVFTAKIGDTDVKFTATAAGAGKVNELFTDGVVSDDKNWKMSMDADGNVTITSTAKPGATDYDESQAVTISATKGGSAIGGPGDYEAGTLKNGADEVPATPQQPSSSGGSGTALGKYTMEFDIAKMREGDTFQFVGPNGTSATVKYEGEAGDEFAQKVADQLGIVTDDTGSGAKGNAILTDKPISVELTKSGDVTLDNETGQPNAVKIQVGALENEQLAISIDSMNTAGLGLDSLDLYSVKKAGASITAVRNAINKVSDQRATLGAMQNRLDHKIANLKVSSENLSAAESRIRDVDMAQEMTQFTKNNILSQAATAMLAQANALPQNVLSLLG